MRNPKDQKEVKKMIRRGCPTVVVVSPPCTAFSIANRTISMAPAKICGSTSPWFAMETAVQRGDTTTTVGQPLLIIFLTSF